MKLRHGQRVWLAANEDEGWPREEAEVESFLGEGVVEVGEDEFVVRVLPVFREGSGDDGLREVTADQVEDPA